MEIKLNEKQFQILGKIQAEKQALQSEFAKVTQRETEVLVLICDAAGANLVEGTQLEVKEGGVLVIPEVKIPDLKKVKNK